MIWLLILGMALWLFTGWAGGALMRRAWRRHGWSWQHVDEALARAFMLLGPCWLLAIILEGLPWGWLLGRGRSWWR